MTLSKSSGFVLISALLFYQSIWAVILLLPVGYWYYCMLMKELLKKKEQEFRLQFREAIISLSSQLTVGYSVENGWKEVEKDLRFLYGEEERIMKELAIMLRQLRLQVSVEQTMKEFADRVQLDDVQSFVTVFVAAKRNGGDMLRIIQDTVRQIGDKIEVKREIGTILAAKKYEFRVMSVIPFGIICYMILSFPEFMDTLYGNLLGMGVMTVCLVAYLGAYTLGMKIADIEV